MNAAGGRTLDHLTNYITSGTCIGSSARVENHLDSKPYKVEKVAPQIILPQKAQQITNNPIRNERESLIERALIQDSDLKRGR